MTAVLGLLALAVFAWPHPSVARARLRRMGIARQGPAQSGAAGPRWRDLTLSARAWVLIAVAAGAAVGIGTAPALGLASTIAIATGGWLISTATRRRASERDRTQLSSALALLCAELDAGSRPASALAAAAEVAGTFRGRFAAAAHAAGDGGDVSTALSADLSTGPGTGAVDATAYLTVLGAAWRAAADSGAGLADVLQRVGDDFAQRRQQLRDVSTSLAGARASALMLSVLPVLGLGLGTAMGAHPVPTLVGSPGGQGLLCAGVALDASGLLWTSHLISRAIR
jgi:tight adherence protein B